MLNILKIIQTYLLISFLFFNLELKDKHTKLPRGVDKRIADTVVTIVGDFLDLPACSQEK